MKIEIKNEKQNPFLKRIELNIDIDHTEEATPSKAALQQWVAKEKKKDVISVEVIDIFSDTGKNTAVAQVFLWDEKKVDDLSKPKEKKKEEAPAEKAPKKEAPAEAKEEKKESE
ncbi:hypothetical protein CL614_02180 [archaeon]|nr:hypothetical protein [archaeon]|tara:strand:- start:5088 stop:5429 length:342 start_codon:yes stop_codon:yes gene_type:complete